MSASGLLTPISPHTQQHSNTVDLIQTLFFFPPLFCIMYFSLCLQPIKKDFDAVYFLFIFIIFLGGVVASVLNPWTFLIAARLLDFFLMRIASVYFIAACKHL